MLLGMLSCATENRALQLRASVRAHQESWDEAWANAQGEGNLELRLRLAHRYFRGAQPDAAVGEDEVRRVLAADVRSVLVLDGLSVEVFRQSIDWADRTMKDAGLAAALQCRAAQVFPAEAQWTMACAQKSEWSKARPLLAQAFARGFGDACEIVVDLSDEALTQTRSLRLSLPKPCADAAWPGRLRLLIDRSSSPSQIRRVCSRKPFLQDSKSTQNFWERLKGLASQAALGGPTSAWGWASARAFPSLPQPTDQSASRRA